MSASATQGGHNNHNSIVMGHVMSHVLMVLGPLDTDAENTSLRHKFQFRFIYKTYQI